MTERGKKNSAFSLPVRTALRHTQVSFTFSSPVFSTSAELQTLFFLSQTNKGTQKADTLSSPAASQDIIALTECDSPYHGCQKIRPAAYQTVGYSATGDMLHQPLKPNHCHWDMAADNQSSQGAVRRLNWFQGDCSGGLLSVDRWEVCDLR